MVDILVMTPSDFDFALKMTDIEKWGYLRTDFERHLLFEPEGNFIARQDNNRVGMITTTSYGHYGFIGGLIVPEKHRDQGIGEALMKKGIEYLQQKGVRSIELDAMFLAAPLYRRLGFRDKYLSLRFCREPQMADITLNRPYDLLIEEIINFDKTGTGLDRSRMLKRYYEQLPENFYSIIRSGNAGYAFLKPCAGEELLIGPMVCDNIQIAEELIAAITARRGEKSLIIGVPEEKQNLVKLLIRNGFHYTLPSLRMYLGENINYEKQVYAILSPGQG